MNGIRLCGVRTFGDQVFVFSLSGEINLEFNIIRPTVSTLAVR